MARPTIWCNSSVSCSKRLINSPIKYYEPQKCEEYEYQGNLPSISYDSEVTVSTLLASKLRTALITPFTKMELMDSSKNGVDRRANLGKEESQFHSQCWTCLQRGTRQQQNFDRNDQRLLSSLNTFFSSEHTYLVWKVNACDWRLFSAFVSCRKVSIKVEHRIVAFGSWTRHLA